jgi:Uma2 family endonuclease
MAIPPVSALAPPWPLENGDRLSRREFERRSASVPPTVKPELIEGVVYMASALRFRSHATPHALIMGWLSTYWFATPGVLLADNPTLRLDDRNEPQPDAVLLLEKSTQVSITEDDYLEGAPELIVEVAGSTASYDLGDKKVAYGRNGVREYLVWCTRDRVFQWFVLQGCDYVSLEPEADQIYRSRTFPGLWLDGAALLSQDLPRLQKTAQQGLASPEHQRFCENLCGLNNNNTQ